MIESNYLWWTILFLAVGTLAIRYSIIAVSHKVRISDRHRELFTYIPAAIIPALVAPMVFFHQGQVAWLAGKERLAVLIVSCVISFYSRNMLATVGFGLIALYALTQF